MTEAQKTRPPNANENLSPSDWAAKTVLVVEDDRTHRSLMDKILKECLLKTALAENGYAALARLDAGERFDLILMDWDMPGLDGLDTVREIRKRQVNGEIPYIPVVGFTSNRRPGDREKCLAAGMDAYLPKDVWLPKWRQTLIDNLLQGFVIGDFDVRQINNVALETDKVASASPSPSSFDLDAFDMQALEQTASLLKSELPIAVDEYLEDAAAYIRDIREGLEKNDAEKTARGSHPLKSNSKGFGLTAVSQIAEAINTRAREGDVETCKGLFPQLQEAFRRAEKKLREMIKRSGY